MMLTMQTPSECDADVCDRYYRPVYLCRYWFDPLFLICKINSVKIFKKQYSAIFMFCVIIIFIIESFHEMDELLLLISDSLVSHNRIPSSYWYIQIFIFRF